jgi:sigma-E factor negative regulatory protein RseC
LEIKLKQNAIVKKIIGDTLAEGEVRRDSACGDQCAACHGCGQRKVLNVRAVNTAGAKPGDSVVIESGTAKVVSLAFFVYILPLAALLFAYFLASSLRLPESACILVSVGAFILGCVFIVLVNRHLRHDRRLRVEITSVISQPEQEA